MGVVLPVVLAIAAATAATRKVATTNFGFHSISLGSGMPEKQFESMRLFASVCRCVCVCLVCVSR